MKDLRLFATAEYPLHCSGLNSLLVCPWRTVMEFMEPEEGEGGAAADTGSAVHAACAALHRGATAAVALDAMTGGVSRYPRADLRDAAGLFLMYAADARNAVTCPYIERPIAFGIKAAEDDPTQEAIQVVGTLDQVRLIDGRYHLWDIKTTKKDPYDMMREYSVQVAAYMVGASMELGVEVATAGCIFPRKYKQPFNTAPVFWQYPWKLADAEYILRGVRYQVSLIRKGIVWHRANSDCGWCRMKSPDACLPKLKRAGL